MDSIHALTEINLDDLVSSFGWQNSPRLSSFIRTIFHAPAAKFARQMLAFDSAVGKSDLPKGARHALLDFAQGVQVFGLENVPTSGPVLFLSNHPGMVDTLALFAAINRADLRIIALNRPFLLSLPETTRHLLYISADASERISAVKKAAAHLRAGGALLTFPAGQIEPDADVYPGALESLNDWTDSAGVFVRFAPETRIVPTFVRGVLWEKAVKHPLTGLKKTSYEREKLGAALQLLAHILFNARPLRVKVQFGQPITLAEVGSNNVAAIHAKIIERMRGLVQNPPDGAAVAAMKTR
ncbi:MAG: 1-acyl-sn-glycerol-3-phosphate acyltransferase [Chloroflexi bacterium]|nr:1-acyl-sn-glycerol-3-phosphate acyltransferase [Chloroflexota bacterium]